MDNMTIVNEGLDLLPQLSETSPLAEGKTAVSHRLHTTPYLTATLIAQRQTAADPAHDNLVKLYQKIDRHFDESELQDLCFRLNVDFDNLPGSGKRDKARELVKFMDRHGRLPQLVETAAKLRLHIAWQDPPQQFDGVAIVARLDVAIVVDIARPTIKDVAHYLDEIDLPANFILLQHAADAFLDATKRWDGFVNAFSQTMNKSKHTFTGAQSHFFLAAPGALLFGLGTIWGTVDEAVVYHYESGTYHPVLAISRKLR